MRQWAKAFAAIASAAGVTASDLASATPFDASGIAALAVAWSGVILVFTVKNTTKTPDLD